MVYIKMYKGRFQQTCTEIGSYTDLLYHIQQMKVISWLLGNGSTEENPPFH